MNRQLEPNVLQFAQNAVDAIARHDALSLVGLFQRKHHVYDPSDPLRLFRGIIYLTPIAESAAYE